MFYNALWCIMQFYDNSFIKLLVFFTKNGIQVYFFYLRVKTYPTHEHDILCIALYMISFKSGSIWRHFEDILHITICAIGWVSFTSCKIQLCRFFKTYYFLYHIIICFIFINISKIHKEITSSRIGVRCSLLDFLRIEFFMAKEVHEII